MVDLDFFRGGSCSHYQLKQFFNVGARVEERVASGSSNYVNGGLTLSALNALNECSSPPDQSWSCSNERTTDRIELFLCSGT